MNKTKNINVAGTEMSQPAKPFRGFFCQIGNGLSQEIMRRNNYIFYLLVFLCFFSSFIRSNAQCPGSDVYVNYNSRCLPALVRFAVTPAYPAGSVYYWDVGHGQISGADTFYYQYTSGGSYGVKVTVVQPNGVQCTITKPAGFLSFNTAESLGFYADQTKLCTLPSTISLHDTTTNIKSRDWFINGVLYPDHTANVNIIDSTPGYTSVTLIVYDYSNCTENVIKQNYINITKNIPINFSSVLTENASHNQIAAIFKIAFDTAGYGITEFDWSFPGGSPSTYTGISPPTVTYSNLSSFHDVSLTVKASTGCSSTFTKANLVGKYYSVVKSNICESNYGIVNYLGNIYETYNKGVQSNLPVNYSFFSGGGGQGVKIKFDSSGTANLIFPVHLFNGICNDTLIVPDLFTILPPLADFTLNVKGLCSAPGKVKMHALYGNPSTGTNTYVWQVFDSSMNELSGSPIGPTSATDTSFVFNQTGIYSIRLITVNTDGCADTILKTNILRVGNPDINFTLRPDTLCVGDFLFVKNLAKMQDVPGNPLSYNWIFTATDTPVTVQYYSRSPKVVFNIPGIYNLIYIISSPPCTTRQNYSDAVFVNGTSGIINLVGNPSCPPATYTLNAVTRTYPQKSPLTYNWSVLPAANAAISNPTSSTPDVTFFKQGYYKIILKVFNGVCTSTIIRDSILIGTVSSFDVGTAFCKGIPLGIKNYSSRNSIAFKWIITPNSGFTINSDTARVPKINFTSAGCYNILLRTASMSLPSCYDTFSRRVCIFQPPAIKDMFSPDSSSHCAPRIDSFFVKSVKGKKFYWDFGDSTSLTALDSEVIHAYLKNNVTGYSVKVAVIDSNGCPSDTFERPDYIKISGPEPSFSVSSKIPCDSGTVTFNNKSQYVKDFYFLYGDNSSIDSNVIKPHFYKYDDYTRDSNIYLPTMYAYDETGCLESASTIVKLFRPPQIKFNVADTVGCMPFSVQFIDSTKYASKYQWNFGNGISDTAFAPLYVYKFSSPPGKPFKVKLIATSDRGCTDSSGPVFIDVHPLSVPTISITASKPLCYLDTVLFKASTTLPVVRYHWKFGDGNLVSDTSSLQTTKYHYVYPGRHKVVLTVFTNYGCADSVIDSSVYSLDSLAPVPPQIDYVSVSILNEVELIFSKSHSGKFSKYIVYRYPGPDSIYSTSNIDDTLFYDKPPQVNVGSASYKYVVVTEDVCGFISPYSIPHQTILLKVNKYKRSALQLAWNKYTGWGSVKNYQLYRRNIKGSFIFLKTLSSLDSTYIDSNLCPGRYTYYVQANDTNGKYVSTSDTASNEPDYLYQSTPLVLRKATVVNNQEIFMNWNPTVQPNYKYYIIDKYSVLNGLLYNYATTTGLSFLDNAVNVNKQSYVYRVSVSDSCGNVSPYSNIGATILLVGSIVNDSRLLTWNAYRQWDNGVSSYHLQVVQNDGSYKDLATLPSSDTTYFDTASHSDLNGPTCYRVYAVENLDINGNSDTSMSNVACPNLLPRIYIPNAFTPNGDSLNDIFIPKGLSIINNSEIKGQKYVFKIYNRWGVLVFETNDFKKGWDGKYQGTLVSAGVYIYSLEAQGYNGQRFYLSGNVTVVR